MAGDGGGAAMGSTARLSKWNWPSIKARLDHRVSERTLLPFANGREAEKRVDVICIELWYLES
jgi:hypothetical protein